MFEKQTLRPRNNNLVDVLPKHYVVFHTAKGETALFPQQCFAIFPDSKQVACTAMFLSTQIQIVTSEPLVKSNKLLGWGRGENPALE